MGSDVLYVFQTIYHGQLRDDSQRLQPNAERPEKVEGIEGFMNDNGCKESGAVEVIVRERVRLAVHAQAEGFFYLHQVDGVGGQRDEDDFHHEDIESFPAKEKVKVATDKHH